MDKPKFTFKNYIKELKKSWVLLLVFLILGTGGGLFFALKNKDASESIGSTMQIAFYNPKFSTNASISPYGPIADIIASKILLTKVDTSIKEEDVPDYKVVENNPGVFTFTINAKSEENLNVFAKAIVKDAPAMINEARGDGSDFKVTVLKDVDGNQTTKTSGTKKRIITVLVAALGSLALAMLIVFVRFDYIAAK